MIVMSLVGPHTPFTCRVTSMRLMRGNCVSRGRMHVPHILKQCVSCCAADADAPPGRVQENWLYHDDKC